jgi:acyl-coenzyme A synthetase/AMP-(fatty) acid ligase/acyl carrier protein
MGERFALGPGDVFLHVTSFGFDISIQDLFGPLTAGAQVVIVERGPLLDPVRLGAAMLRHGATMMDATPAMWQMLLDAGWSADGNLTMLSAGEALSAGLAERLLRSPGRLWNLYGPTETTIISSAARIDPGEPVTIGRPVSNTQMYVLDPHLQPVPVGVRGTLYIGGDGLARGYLNQPALTADRFIPDPFRSDPGARLYDTGDRASYLPDGRIVYHGRVDQQIKIRGHRIEPAEIEAVLRNHASVRAAAVVSQGEGLKKRLIAFVIASDGCQVVPAMLRTHLRQQLPDYMVPARFVAQDVFPLTQSGKLDRIALSERVVADDVSLEGSSRPFSPVETALTTIWSEVLDVEQPRLDDDFFDLGGHSLMAVQILARISGSLGVDLPLRSIFDAPTIAALAELVEVQGSLGDGQGPEQPASSFFGHDA